ncbi:hypothetical protein ACFL2Q_12680 [Thermodesulfobacteriota bacterium]
MLLTFLSVSPDSYQTRTRERLSLSQLATHSDFIQGRRPMEHAMKNRAIKIILAGLSLFAVSAVLSLPQQAEGGGLAG